MTRNLLTAAQAARRLGVKVETVYAYVSRGVLGRTLAEDGRTSRFDTREIDALARRGRPRQGAARAGTVEVSLATSITGIQGDRLVFRGHDAATLARQTSFEAVAELLWTGVLPEQPLAWPKPAHEPLRGLRLSETASPLDHLCVATSLLSAAHPLRVDLRPPRVAQHARVLIASLPEALPFASGASPSRPARARSVAERLLARLSPLPATGARVRLLDAALVLLADHELATSTLAARVAASTRADPFAVVLAGFGAVSGPLHGKAAVSVQRLIAEARDSSAEAAIARVVANSERIPGFGHPVYRGTDPRAACLLGELKALAKPDERALLEGLAQLGTRASSHEPNVDFALGAVAYALGMPLGSTEAVFAIARTAGFIAHAIEEYGETPLRFRARSIYLGPNLQR